MTPEQKERIRKLFKAACEKDPQQRAEFLRRACGDDELVRREVESLLANDDEADTFLQTPALGKTFAEAHPESLVAKAASTVADRNTANVGANGLASESYPERIGQYRILGILGEGGMGVVYRAEQENPRRLVALKVIKPGVESEATLKRFEHEGQVLGWLQHPGIAKVFEAGRADTGQGPQPFFAMELVHGQPITEYAQAQRLGIRQRLELIAKVCDAAHYAHQKGVIHRDLKSGNILVDESGEPRILDFGVARATDADIRTTTLQTAVGQLVGTIAYMSPEQIAGDPRELDTRSDVYSLGVVAYELLTGRLPVEVSGKTIPQAARAISEEEPTQLRSINRVFRGDVDTIISKALEKDKNRRYQSASDFAADIRRYLSDQPIAARPMTTMYQLRKFTRRNKAFVASVAVAFVLLSAALLSVTLERNRAVRAERHAGQQQKLAEVQRAEAETQSAEAQRQAAIAQAVNDFLNNDLLAAVDPLKQQGRDVTVLQVLEKASEAIEDKFREEPLVEAAVRLTLGNTYMSLGRYEPAEPHLQRAVALQKEELGEEHADTLSSLMSLGFLYVRQGRYDEAEPLFVKLLDRYRRALGEDASETLSTMGVLGVLYKRQGRYAEAEPLYVKVLEARRRVLGDEHRHTMVSMNNLAILYRIQGQYDKAEPLYAEALALSRRVLGEEHPDTLNLMNSLGVLYKRQRRFDEAESMCLAVVEAQRRVLGKEHPDALLSVSNLASLCVWQKRYEKAASLCLEALEGRRRMLGEEHPDTLTSMHDLGSVYTHAKRFDEAEPLLVKALEARRRVLGDDHPDTGDSLSCLAGLYQHQDRHDVAVPLYREALSQRRRTLGDDDRYTLKTLGSLVESLIVLGKFEEAEPLAEECYERRKKVYGLAGDETREAIELLVNLYDGWGKPDQATQFRELLSTQNDADAARPPS